MTMKACGFSRGERLTEKRDFKKVYKEGKKVRTSAFFHAYLLEKPGSSVRLGLSVSRKVGNAVVRNRVKRRFREIFRRNKGAVENGVDIVLIAKPGVQNYPFWDLEKVFLSEIITYNV